MVRGLVSQIDPKKEKQFWTTLIIVLLKEQSTFTRGVIKFVGDLRQIGGFNGYSGFLHPGPPREFLGPRTKGNLAPSSNSPNNDTQTKSTTVCHKQGISTTQMN